MKKVLFVIDTLQLGGAEQSLFQNISRFKNIDPVVCHIYPGETLKPKFIESGIKVYSINLKKKYGFIAACGHLSGIVKKERPDLMVAYLTRSEIVTRLVGRSRNVPVVGTFVSDLYSKSYNEDLSFKARTAVSIFRYINKFTAGFCKGFIANSQPIKKSNAKYLDISLDKVKVINRGRDSRLFPFRLPHSSANRRIRFLNIGRLFPVKGQGDLILGFHAFLKQCPDAVLDIVGEGPARESLSLLIKELKLEQKVFLLGARNDIAAIIHEYDCFVFPSYSEGFSGSVVEAMFTGLPILASDIPANKELVKHLETGYLFARGAVEGITEAMIWYVNNLSLAQSLAVIANGYAKAHFEIEQIVAEFEEYLNRMTKEK